MTLSSVLNPSARLRPSHDLRRDTSSEVLVGGSPTRLLRLSSDGAKLVRSWFAGTPVGTIEAHRRLAWRLVDRGLANVYHPVDAESWPADITVVIPAKDDGEGLIRTLSALASEAANNEFRGAGGILPVVVVDDGSVEPLDADTLRNRIPFPKSLRLTVVRQTPARGPAAARNLGLGAVHSPYVAFVDAGVIVSPQQLAKMRAELQDPTTVLVAPRVRSKSLIGDQRGGHPSSDSTTTVTSILADYEQRWSPLDLGPHASLVGFGRRITYVPSTCLLGDVKTLENIGRFTEQLRYGEDVDLVWRAGQFGWIRYLPEINVTHPPRRGLSEFAAQRFRYGTSAGRLARRHPEHLAPIRMNRLMALFWVGIASRRTPGVLTAMAAAVLSYRRLTKTLQVVESVPDTPAVFWPTKLLGRAVIGSGRGLATASCRTWLPASIAVGSIARSTAAGWAARTLTAVGLARRFDKTSTRRTVTDIAVGCLDDLSYSLGVWSGCCSARTFAPLLPRLMSAERPQKAVGDRS